MTLHRAMLAAALTATLLYLPSLRNRFALDDSPIIEDNPAAHSVVAALRAVGDPYWPPQHQAGLWRPLTILSYAVDWQLSGGSTAVLHATNTALHAAATALAVPLFAAFVPVPAALAGALVFAVHPVHVEAVANLVGRAEMLVAVFLVGALLVARRVRRRQSEGAPTLGLEAAVLLLVALALLAKEHAVVAVALLALDDLAGSGTHAARLPLRTYAAVVLLTAAWYLAHRAAEGNLAFAAVAPTFYGLDTVGRLSTMFPAVLTVVRLLVWPFDLSPDYHPHVLERLEGPTAAGVLGALLVVAFLAMAVLTWRRHRAVATGLLLIGVAWAPTSNFAFPTGIVLAERTLYLPSVGLCLIAASGWAALTRRLVRPAVPAAVALAVLVPFGARSLAQIPVWRSTRDLVVSALLAHPESYKVHHSAARVFVRLGDRAAGLREYRLAIALYDRDPYLLTEAAGAALEAGHIRESLQFLRMSERHDAHYTLTLQLLANALLQADSVELALEYARLAVQAGPTDEESARMLAAAFLRAGLPDSALAVWPAFEERGGSRFERWLLSATTWAAVGGGDSARAALSQARSVVPDDSIAQRRLAWAEAVVAAPSGR